MKYAWKEIKEFPQFSFCFAKTKNYHQLRCLGFVRADMSASSDFWPLFIHCPRQVIQNFLFVKKALRECRMSAADNCLKFVRLWWVRHFHDERKCGTCCALQYDRRKESFCSSCLEKKRLHFIKEKKKKKKKFIFSPLLSALQRGSQ